MVKALRSLSVALRCSNHLQKLLNQRSSLSTQVKESELSLSDPSENARAESIQKRPRDKKLAFVIREGLASLNETSRIIQDAAVTRRSLFSMMEVPKTDRQSAEEHRILNVARECLDQLAHKSNAMSLHGEPIVFLQCRVKPSIKSATIFWALPYSILLDDEISLSEKDILTKRLNERIDAAVPRLQYSVHSRLSLYYPPRIRLEPASMQLLFEYFPELIDE